MITAENVVVRLSHFGVASSGEDVMLSYLIDKVKHDILNFCNIAEVPESLDYTWTDMVCGEYLKIKKNSGQDIGIDMEPAVSSISEGDTSVSFAVSKQTPAEMLDKLINSLLDQTKELVKFRKLKW